MPVALGLDQADAAEVLPYDKLRSAKLEALIDQAIAFAFPPRVEPPR